MSRPVDRVLASLEGARRSGQGYVARCPAHKDRAPSLSVTEGDDGRVLLHCHAGCTPEAIVSALGSTLADLFEPNVKLLTPASEPLGRLVARYDYCDESGAVIYQVRRYQPKKFLQFRPDGRGGWTPGLEGVRRDVPYRLHHLLGKPAVLVSEGEKDVERLVEAGLPATCNAGGAGKWTDAHTAHLKAAGVTRVAILPDHDGPGEQHALGVARSCFDAGLAVRIVRLPGLPAKGDVSDWLDAGHSVDDLKAILRRTPAWTDEDRERAPSQEPAKPSACAPREPHVFAPILVRLDSVQPEPVDWIWPGRLAKGKLTILAGDPGLGKSFVTNDIAARITLGAEWPDGGTAPSGTVLLLSAEDGLRDTIRPRLDRLGADPSRVHVLTAIRQGGAERAFSLDLDCARLHEAIVKTGAVLVDIDPITAYLGGTDSYKDADVRAILTKLARLAEELRVAVLCVMHLRKKLEGNALQRLSGSIGFGAAARIVLGIGKDEHDPERRLFAGVKSNLGRLAPTLAFRITGDEDAGVLVWEDGEVEGIDGERVLTSGPVNHGERDLAAEFFDRELPPGTERAVRELTTVARDYGLSKSTLNRGKVRLRVDGYKSGYDGGWIWRRPLLPRPGDRLKVLTKTLSGDDVSTFEADPMKSTENAGAVPKVLTTSDSEYLRGETGTLDGAAASFRRREY